jgi:iron-sulfur cluster repair protein YtfE (RIC family)
MSLRSLMQAGPAKANELFAKLSETSDGAVKTRERLFAELKAELELHTSLEEQYLFPVLRRNAETKDLVVDAIRDNKELRSTVAELDGMAKNDATFSERLSELQKVFRQHARDDRKELLPAVQRALSEEQVQGVTDKMEAGIAEAEQAKQDEAEERRAKARQEREAAEFLARQAELRGQEEAKAERKQAAAEQRVRDQARQIAAAALKPVAATAKAVDEAARQTNAAFGAGRPQSPSLALTNMFMWPWLGAMQSAQQNSSSKTRGVSSMEEVIPLGEEVLEVGKRTENRGTARIRRFVVETPIERQVTLLSERVVVERRRPLSDKVTGEILTEVTVEIVETEEVPTVEKRVRLREEIVVRTERTQRVEMVKETVRRDEVEIQQPSRKRGNQNARTEG